MSGSGEVTLTPGQKGGGPERAVLEVVSRIVDPGWWLSGREQQWKDGADSFLRA